MGNSKVKVGVMTVWRELMLVQDSVSPYSKLAFDTTLLIRNEPAVAHLNIDADFLITDITAPSLDVPPPVPARPVMAFRSGTAS